jgi:hypothetical protein
MGRFLVISGLILLILTLAAGCGKDKSNDPDHDKPNPEQLIVGSWQWIWVWEYHPVYFDTTTVAEDEMFWVFTGDGEYCDHEYNRWDSCYHTSCQGTFVITATTVTIDCSSGSRIVAAYEFSENADTLFCSRGLDFMVMIRDEAPPNFARINSNPLQRDRSKSESALSSRRR